VVSRKVEVGAQVEPGQVLAVIADPKIALKIKGLDVADRRLGVAGDHSQG